MTKNKKLGLGKYFKAYKMAIMFYILMYIIAGAASILNTVLFAEGVQYITLGLYGKAINISLICILTVVIKRLAWYVSGVIYNKYSVKIMAKLNADLSVQAFKLNSKTYSDHDTGTFVQRIVTDPERVVEKFADMVDVITDIITALVMLIYICTLNIFISIIVVELLILGFTLELIRVKLKRRTRHKVHKANDKIHSLTTEIVRSEKDIKSLGLEQMLTKVSKDNYDNYQKAVYAHSSIDMNFWSSRNFLIESLGIVMLIVAISLMDKAMLTLASFMIIYSNHDRIYGLIWGVGNIASSIADIKVSTNRMFSLFDEDEFVTEKFGNLNLEKINGNIEFKNVSFTFKDYEYNFNTKTRKSERKFLGEKQIFNNLSFTIPQNKTVAFVGKSGSGKSTILNLLAKMHTVDFGEILIDGHNINDFNKQTLRKTFSLVNQFPYIFDMTIKENLTLAKENATDEEIKRVIKLACLEEFINSLPNGIESKVGESGIKLSGGQNQRLAIARAMLRNSPVILFDESTSALDNFAQNEVKKSIDSLKGSSTIVIVAHRLSTIKDSDIIFFLDEGKIMAQGTFDELFNSNEKFKNMFLAENI